MQSGGGGDGGGGGGKGMKRGRKRKSEAERLEEEAAAWLKQEPDPESEAEVDPYGGLGKEEWTKRNLAGLADLARRLGIDPDETDPDDEEYGADPYAFESKALRENWDSRYGAYEDTTSIPPMLYTDEPVPPRGARVCDTIEIYTVNIGERNERLQWPLHVFGMVALRDSIDRNRNIIFNRTRDNCQTLTDKVPYLDLTGPSRGIVSVDEVIFEAVLKVKGVTESEDRELSFIAMPFNNRGAYSGTHLIKRKFPSKLSTIEFTFGLVSVAVEATISVQVKNGSWPDDWRGFFAARIDSIKSQEIMLLDSRNDKVPVTDDGMIMLSRRVTSVENTGKLTVSVSAKQEGSNKRAYARKSFKPLIASRSCKSLKLDFCEMEVTVAWSTFRKF